MKSNEKLIEILLAEYKARRTEIDNSLNAAFNTSYITILAISALISFSPFIYNSGLTGIFALFAIAFYIISLTQLRLLLQVCKLSEYIAFVIKPQLEKAIRSVSNKDKKGCFEILTWEISGRKTTHDDVNWSLPIEAARYGLPILAGLSAFMAFLLTYEKSGFLKSINIVFIVGNIVLIFYSIYATLKTRQRLRRETQ